MASDPSTSKVEDVKEFGEGERGEFLRWSAELKLAKKNDKDWISRSEKIIKRYRDERTVQEKNDKKFNILWSNTETLKKALYARTPVPQVDRRYRDKDPIGLKAAMVLERSTSYIVEDFDFDGVMRGVVLDYQLPGRAVTRVFYRPDSETQLIPASPISYEPSDFLPNVLSPDNPIEIPGAPIYAEDAVFDEKQGCMCDEVDVVVYETAEAVNVYWKDFRMGKARNWEQVPWCGFRAYMTRDQLKERFGTELGKKIPCNYSPHNIGEEDLDEGEEIQKKAEIWEIWDKVGNEVVWVCPDYSEKLLDKSDPHLKFDGFYPCTPPLIMTETSDTMEPVPEYIQYQDQAKELDELTVRINLIVEAIRVTGVYDQNANGVQKMLESSAENRIYPITNWQQFVDAGGLNGAVSWFPVEQLQKVLAGLYAARAETKAEMYEITGLSDIMRGASDPRESATAQRGKIQFGSMRLTDKQDLIAKHARDVVRLITEIIAENFEMDTLQKMTGLNFDEDNSDEYDMEDQQAMQGQQQNPMGQMGQAEMRPPQMQTVGMMPPRTPAPGMPQPKPSNDEIWAQIMELLRDDPIRSFRISIETDSTIQPNEQEEKESRIEFLRATSEFMQGAMQITASQPVTTPLVLEMLLFGIRGFRAGRELEQKFEEVAEKINAQVAKQLANPQPQPDPIAQKAQAEIQLLQQKGKADIQAAQVKQQGEQQKQQSQVQGEAQKLQFDQQEHAQEMKQSSDRFNLEMVQMERKGERELMLMDRKAQMAERAAMNKQRASESKTEKIEAPAPVPASPSLPDITVNTPEITMPEIIVNIDANADKKITLDRDKEGNVTGGESTSK